MLSRISILCRVSRYAWAFVCLGAAIGEVAAQVDSSPSAARAERYLVDVCRIGPRISGSQGMLDQQQLLIQHFQALRGRIGYQSFDAPHPVTGEPVRMTNLIVSWHPQATERVLICCHYDTRPEADRELPFRPKTPFLGANDGGSGVAALMELGHHMASIEPALGVDFVFFDAEEFIYGRKGEYFVGSEYFAKEYRDNPPAYEYRCGILLDMIGDRNLNVYMERNSLKFAPNLTRSIFAAARRAGVSEFVARAKHDVRDDHIPLNEIAGIPTTDLIDFDYPHWHKLSDVPSQCSGESIAKVCKVVLTWLKDIPVDQLDEIPNRRR